MTEITPLLEQIRDAPRYNAASNTESDVECEEEELLVHEAEVEIPLMEIVKELFLEWQRNGAHEDLTPQDIMAMHLQYRRVTRGRRVFHAQHSIISHLARAMLRWKVQAQICVDDLHAFELGSSILRNLRENWPSIIQFDEELAQNVNVYHPPTYRERMRNAWRNCIRECTASKSFIFQVVFTIILLGWPFSLMFMGAKYMSQCSRNNFFSESIVLIGFVGISALSLRLLLVFIEKCCWFPMRTVISYFWIAMKLLELIYLLTLIIELWIYIRDSPSFNYEGFTFCIKTFYTFMFWMKIFSSVIALVWLVVNFSKALFWMTRIRYQNMPLFVDDSEMHPHP